MSLHFYLLNSVRHITYSQCLPNPFISEYFYVNVLLCTSFSTTTLKCIHPLHHIDPILEKRDQHYYIHNCNKLRCIVKVMQTKFYDNMFKLKVIQIAVSLFCGRGVFLVILSGSHVTQ